VLTDNAKAYTDAQRFVETAADLGIRLKRTRPYRPRTNGKVERFHRRLKDEWAYRRAYPSNAERRQAFEEWLEFYHHRRPLSALHGLTPMAVLVNNVHGNHN
jgi:transposase InsO family protein